MMSGSQSYDNHHKIAAVFLSHVRCMQQISVSSATAVVVVVVVVDVVVE